MSDVVALANPDADPRLAEALRAIARGWILIPLIGKHPINTAWQKAKAPSPKKVSQWLKVGRNLGVLTGQASGIAVIDDDTAGLSAARRPY